MDSNRDLHKITINGICIKEYFSCVLFKSFKFERMSDFYNQLCISQDFDLYIANCLLVLFERHFWMKLNNHGLITSVKFPSNVSQIITAVAEQPEKHKYPRGKNLEGRYLLTGWNWIRANEV